MKFERLLELVKESPDYSYDNHWRQSDYCFMYYKGMILKGHTPATHFITRNLFLKFMKENEGTYIFEDEYFGGVEKEFGHDRTFYVEITGNAKGFLDLIKSKKLSMSSRSQFIKNGVLEGRIWKSENLVSFWNGINTVSLSDMLKLGRMMPEIKKYNIEFSRQWTSMSDMEKNHIINKKSSSNIWGTWKEVIAYLKKPKVAGRVKKDQNEKERTEDLDVVHLMDPMEKGRVMKEKGIVPKTPIPMMDRMKREGD